MTTLILAGSNQFPSLGSPLQGCVNDLWTIYRWAASALPKGTVDVTTLDNQRDTSFAFRDALAKACRDAKDKELVWLHNSSHGTTIPIKGKNHGALCHYNSDWSNLSTFVIDDDILTACAVAQKGVRILVTIDACEFGDSLRLVSGLCAPVQTRQITPRFIQPPMDLQIEIDENGTKPRAIAPTNISSVGFCERGPGKTCADVLDSSGAYGAGTKMFTPEIRKGEAISKAVARESAVLRANNFEQRPVFAGPEITIY